MEMETREVGSVQVVHLTGGLDAMASSDVRSQLAALVQNGSTRLAIDMSGVTRIDSMGLGALVTTLKGARDRGGDLVLASLPQPVRAVVELTRLHRVFVIYDDVEVAASELAR